MMPSIILGGKIPSFSNISLDTSRQSAESSQHARLLRMRHRGRAFLAHTQQAGMLQTLGRAGAFGGAGGAEQDRQDGEQEGAQQVEHEREHEREGEERGGKGVKGKKRGSAPRPMTGPNESRSCGSRNQSELLDWLGAPILPFALRLLRNSFAAVSSDLVIPQTASS